MRKLRVAIVGFGFMGKTHAKNIIQSEWMELVAIVDPQAGAISQVSGNIDTGEIDPDVLRQINQYASLDDCLAAASLDAVFVCVHTLLHYEMALKCLRHGLHVFIEKPFVLDVKEGEALIAEAQKRNLKLAVGHVVRYMPAYMKLQEIYQSGLYGSLKFIALSRFSGMPGWGEWGKRRKEFGSSGGALFDLVIHDIDFLQHLLGMPDTVDSTCIAGDLSEHDYVSAFWQYNDRDVRVKVEGGLLFHSLFPFEATIKAAFEKASIAWSSANGFEMKVVDTDSCQTIPLGDANDGYAIEASLFAKSILDNEQDGCPADSALNTIRLCYQHRE